MLKRLTAILLLLIVGAGVRAGAISLDPDSIAAWGKFPRFCMKVYRWGDKFFNGYDTTYVKPTGYRMNVKLRTDNWLEWYTFRMSENKEMFMRSHPSTSVGLWLTYMAVSAGYDINLSKLYSGANDVRKRFNLQFNCSLFAASLSYSNNTSEYKITSLEQGHNKWDTDINVPNMNSRTLVFYAYYFFNHHKYSYAAAYSFGRKQVKSAGTFFLGFTYWNQRYDFDFSGLPENFRPIIPPEWKDGVYRVYRVRVKNYGIKAGYGYNWAMNRHWLLGVSESPTLGMSKGYINSDTKQSCNFSLYNVLRLSVVWNNGPFFAGAVGYIQSALLHDKVHTMMSNTANLEVSFGYRFNLW